MSTKFEDMNDDIGPIKNKLGVVEWKTDEEKFAHIKVDADICNQCPHHLCIAGCPTRCFNFMEVDGKVQMVFQYEDCVECGTCDIMCDQGAVSWEHPRGSFGVNYQQG